MSEQSLSPPSAKTPIPVFHRVDDKYRQVAYIQEFAKHFRSYATSNPNAELASCAEHVDQALEAAIRAIAAFRDDERLTANRIEDSTTEQSTTSLTFLGVPLEIRALIFHHLFHNNAVKTPDTVLRDEPADDSPLTNILLVNKQIHHEVIPIFYRDVLFHLCYLSFSNICGPSIRQVRWHFGQRARHVRHVHYYGKDPDFVLHLTNVFPNLQVFDMSLGSDIFDTDSRDTTFECAARHILSRGEWIHAVMHILDHQFGSDMKEAVAGLRWPEWKRRERKFKVRLHWDIYFRYSDVHARALVDLDEWIFRIWNPWDSDDRTVYTIRQGKKQPFWPRSEPNFHRDVQHRLSSGRPRQNEVLEQSLDIPSVREQLEEISQRLRREEAEKRSLHYVRS